MTATTAFLDIAHREHGPAVLVLGNTVRSGKHSRGSGVVEDRADIVFEVRDATDFHPTGKRPWVEELPPQSADDWAARSTRRKRRAKFRLAFICTKFRLGEEPEPFVVEVDMTDEPWAIRDVTAQVDAEGVQAQVKATEEQETTIRDAVDRLKDVLLRREANGEPPILKKQAEQFLTAGGLTRKVARQAINSPTFEVTSTLGKGHPKTVRLTLVNQNVGRNTPSRNSMFMRLPEHPYFGRRFDLFIPMEGQKAPGWACCLWLAGLRGLLRRG